MSKLIIEIDTLHSGQARPYTDSLWEANISAKCTGMLTNDSVFYRELRRETVIQLAKIFVQHFDENNNSWPNPKLTNCKPIGPTNEMITIAHPKWLPGVYSRWNIVIKQEYLD
jgi:hypothetical protein